MRTIRRFLLAIAVLGMVPISAVQPASAEDPPPPANAPPVPQGAEPEDPDGQPYPPDGVTDPNATYPTDGTGETTDQGEAGAAAPDTPPAGNVPPD